MNDDMFLHALETCTLPEADFNHAAHVRAGFLYLKKYGFPEASARMCSALRAYVTSLGKASRYHETITIGFMALINSCIYDKRHSVTWHGFQAAHPDLLQKGALLKFYPRHILDSAKARAAFTLVPLESPRQVG